MNQQARQSIVLPMPQRLVLRNFSLYRKRRTVEVDFNKSVLCLAGANGLGKSTFLSALNYAITGTVAKPGLNFLGASKFYEDSSGYSKTYFDGRIAPEDHEVAEVEIDLAIGKDVFHLTRGMFASSGLRAFSITREDGRFEDYSKPDITDAERHGRYVAEVLASTGLKSFPQLVFLQWFVLTFDEQRHLLFWSDRIIEQALFLAFGFTSASAESAEALQRAFDSSDSKVRNLQWQASGVRKRLDALEAALGGGEEASGDDDVQGAHEALLAELDAAGQEHEQLLISVRDAQVRLDEAAVVDAAARQAYESKFQERISVASTAQLHPLVAAALANHHCGICGSTDASVGETVSRRLAEPSCPLCGFALTVTSETETAGLTEVLADLGEQSVQAADQVRALREHLSRQVRALDVADVRIRTVRRELEEFRSANTRALLQGTDGQTLIEDARSGLRREISDLLGQKDVAIAKRDEARKSLDMLRRELGRRFVELESEFVPQLQELAYEFLGVPLQVDLERRGHHLGLALVFQGSERSTADTLSESQRFFMDIALRMALARKMSTPEAPATLYIDTPEGSLDIAYEGRAGKMFGLFAGLEDRIVMTANINTSRLLLELAQACGSARMQLIRMTDWSDLTTVQQDAQLQFEEAYADIEARLVGA